MKRPQQLRTSNGSPGGTRKQLRSPSRGLVMIAMALNLYALAGAQTLAPATGLQVTVDTKPAKAAPAPSALYTVPLPPITVSNQTIVRVGGQVIDLARQADLTPERGAALAAEFGVPQGVLTPLLQKAAKGTRPDGAQFAQDLRKATTNYTHWLNRYNSWKPADETLTKKKEEGLTARQKRLFF